MSRKRNILYTKIILLMLALTVLPVSITATSAYFSDSQTVQAGFSAGTWSDRVCVSSLCPNWGVSGTCRWVVFIHGKGFTGNCNVRLVKDNQGPQAIKSWVISGSLILAVFDLRGTQTGMYDVKIVFDDGSQGLLQKGFKVMDNFFGSPFSFQAYCDLENKLSVERRFDPQNPKMLLVTLLSGCPGQPDKAYLVGGGQFINGKISKKNGKKLLAFELPATPLLRYDLMLQYGEISLFFENAVTLFNLNAQPRISSIDPSSAVIGGVVDINVYGENLSDKTELWLERGDVRVKPATTRTLDNKHMICRFDLTAADPGSYSLKAIDNNGISISLADCLELKTGDAHETPADVAKPENKEDNNQVQEHGTSPGATLSISPETGSVGSSVCITVSGGSFAPGMQARLSGKQAVSWSVECTIASSTMQCVFNLAGIPAGTYALDIMDTSGNIIYKAGQFKVI